MPFLGCCEFGSPVERADHDGTRDWGAQRAEVHCGGPFLGGYKDIGPMKSWWEL